MVLHFHLLNYFLVKSGVAFCFLNNGCQRSDWANKWFVHIFVSFGIYKNKMPRNALPRVDMPLTREAGDEVRRLFYAAAERSTGYKPLNLFLRHYRNEVRIWCKNEFWFATNQWKIVFLGLAKKHRLTKHAFLRHTETSNEKVIQQMKVPPMDNPGE